MMNLNDTISAFRCCTLVPPRCSKCPLTEMCKWSLSRDRCKTEVKLSVNHWLTAQEPRVMTLEEVKQERICWIEDADDGMTVRLFPATMFGIGEYANGSKNYMFLAQKPWAIDENDCEWWYLIDDYGETWRCWTSRPTDEQREAVKWE